MKCKIFQVDLKNPDARYLAFTGLEMVQEMGLQVKKENYKVVWEGEIEEHPTTMQTLESLYLKLNVGQKPADYRGHSLSVSDIVELDGKFHYCDSYGFTQIEF